ncbi:hypothetical protein QVA66_08945 [Staphylococcus chromogenes]|nr:hypothetical protein [Staphylococcus chromogenes]
MEHYGENAQAIVAFPGEFAFHVGKEILARAVGAVQGVISIGVRFAA